MITPSALQTPTILPLDERVLSEFTGVYQWAPNAFVYLQLWDELSGFGKPRLLVAFDESGEVRVLYPSERDHFFAGPGAAVPTSIQSRIEFQRNGSGKITSLKWQREDRPVRTAQRVDIEEREDVQFSNGDVRLAGTLISPIAGAKHPAIILVHGSGAENREYLLPFARFLIRHGMAVLGYDKRGVGSSTGDWNTASFDDLAGDVVAAFEYLKTRRDIDATAIGLLGVSQAGWIMPIAAVRSPGIAFLVSDSGAAVSVDETTLDEARNEMTGTGMRAEVVEQILELMKRQYRFARTSEGWDDYFALRGQIAARLGTPPPQFPGTRDDPLWRTMRAIYFVIVYRAEH
jgi:pimeloyl-ACP methyl ester carboxylesterase